MGHRIACLLAALTLLAPSQTRGPLEVKPPPPKRDSGSDEPGPGRKPAGEVPPPAREPALPGVYREVITDRDGRVISTRGAEITGHFPVEGRPPELEPIEMARQVAWEFTQGLPDYTCEQWTSRYESKSRRVRWKLRDRVFADVVFSGGRENYVNIKVNNKPLKRGRTPFDSGTWSTGEYGTIQLDVLSHNTAAAFTFKKETTFGRSPSLLYDYTVEQPNSHWRLEFEGHHIQPAFQGQIWIDPGTRRVQRLEMQARGLPVDYPLNVVEMTVDYGLARVAGRSITLPVRAENLACVRDSYRCTRNETEFRNYKKFSTDSNVTATDSTIRFEGEDQPGAEKK